MEPVDWGPGLAVLLTGLVAGAALVWRVFAAGRTGAAADLEGLELRDLEARRDVVLAQLRELDDTAARRSPAQQARQRYALELQAARVLSSLERLGGGSKPQPRAAQATASRPEPEEAPPAAAETSAPPSALRGFLWGAGSALALGLLMYFVSQSAEPRTGDAPVTGTAGMPASEAPAAPDPQLEALVAAVQARPDDVEARIALARGQLEREDLMAVWNETQAVLERHPGHPEALSYQALVRLAMGQPEIAEQMLQKAVEGAPDLVEPRLHLALVYYRMDRVDEGAAVLAEVRRRFPDQATLLDRVTADLEAQTGLGVASGDSHAGVASPDEDPRADMAASAPEPRENPADLAGRDRISGTLELAADLQGKVAPGVVFVLVRDAGSTSGPPLAVKRLVASAFPMAFEVSSADSMMGAELPDRMRLEVRLDGDGDAMSKDAMDPKASVDDLALGTTGLRLVLSR